MTLGAEWLHLVPVSNLARALAAIPLGLAVTYAIVRVAGGAWESRMPRRSPGSIR